MLIREEASKQASKVITVWDRKQEGAVTRVPVCGGEGEVEGDRFL